MPSILVNDYNLKAVFMIIMGNTASLYYMWGNWGSKVNKMLKAILLIGTDTYLTWDKICIPKQFTYSVYNSVCACVHASILSVLQSHPFPKTIPHLYPDYNLYLSLCILKIATFLYLAFVYFYYLPVNNTLLLNNSGELCTVWMCETYSVTLLIRFF